MRVATKKMTAAGVGAKMGGSSPTWRWRLAAWALGAALGAAPAVVVLAPSPAQAQGAEKNPDDKAEKKIEEFKDPNASKRPTLKNEDKSPSFSSEEFVRSKKLESLKKLDEQIRHLRDLLKAAPKTHPKRVEYLFNLAEIYWDKAKYYGMKAYQTQDECFALGDGGDKGKIKACKAQMKREIAEGKRLRTETVGLYVEIINDFPTFKDLDLVYYYMGANLQEIGKKAQALEYFKRLLAEFPDSKHVPSVLVAFGDYYFDAGEMELAKKFYDRVPKGTAVYGYALYKKAWVAYNLDNKPKSIELFEDTIQYAKKRPDFPNSAALQKQSTKDVVLAYSHFGKPGKALSFFTDIAGDKETAQEMAERLAVLYADKGNFTDSTAMYRELMLKNQTSVKTISWQYEIVRNQLANNQFDKSSVQELVRLMNLVQYADQGKFTDVKEHPYEEMRKQVETLTRRWATTYHRTAQKTKNPDIYAMSYFLYKYFTETFPKSEAAYTMNFFYAELLYKSLKWEEAASAYERALEIEPKGEFTNDAVHGLVLSYFKIIDTPEQRKAVEAKVVDEEGKDVKGDAERAQVKEIPEMHKKFLWALDKYIELNPKGERIVDVKYKKAYTFYEFNHFDKAIPLFEDVAFNHSNHQLAIFAAELHLDAINALQDYDQLERAVLKYLEKKPLEDEAFNESVAEIHSQIRFKKCNLKDDAKEWSEAAKCYVQYARDFPEGELLEEALYNAALDFERLKEIGKAIQVRIALLKNTKEPDSKMASKTLYNIGANYHALAMYTPAAKFYELYVANFKDRENAETALANAAEFRRYLGQYDRAILDYEKYLEFYGKRDKNMAATSYFEIAELLEAKKQPREAMEHYERYIRKFGRSGTPDQLLQAHINVAMYYWSRQGSSNRKRALQEFDRTLKVYKRFSDKEKMEMQKGREAAAQAMFMKGEDVFEDMAKITIDSKNEKELQTRLKKKIEVANEARDIFKEVILFKHPHWAIAALYRIGAGFQDFAESIRSTHVPKRLTYDQQEIYRGLLEDKASLIENDAVAFYIEALNTARKERWFNKYSKDAEVRLAKLRPRDWRRPSELRAEPGYAPQGFSKVGIIEKVQDEDRLQDFTPGGAEEAADSGEEQAAAEE